MDETDGDPMFEELVESFVARVRAGEVPDIEALATRNPRFAGRIRELMPALVMVERDLSLGGDPGTAREPIGLAPGASSRCIGDFLILREIGRGGMGVVYEAVQQSLGRHVALKVLPWAEAAGAAHIERFQIEARAAARLHHTNIVPVFGVGEHEGTHYYAMQYIRGRGLDEVIEEVSRLRDGASGAAPARGAGTSLGVDDGLLPTIAAELMTGRFDEARAGTDAGAAPPAPTEDRDGPAVAGEAPSNSSGPPARSELADGDGRYYRGVANAMLQVAEALAYAHSQGILHRDIKPSNLMMDARGTVWVTDFGLAKAEGSDGPTRTGDIVGTLRYMAPERFDGHSDPRADVYAIGSTLYELLTLKPLFEATSRAALIDKILRHESAAPRSIDRRVPRDLEVICLKCLSKEPSRRYGSAEELAAELRRFLAGEPIRARRSGLAERVWRWSRRNPAPAGATGAVALALVAVTAIAILYADRQRQFADAEAMARSQQTEATQKIERLADDLEAERAKLEDSLRVSNRRLAIQHYERGLAAFEKDQIGRGLIWMAEAWHSAVEAKDIDWQRAARNGMAAWADSTRGVEGVFSHARTIVSLAVSPDGKAVITGGEDHAATVWDVATGGPIRSLTGLGDKVNAVGFSPDGRTVVTGGDRLRLWSRGTFEELPPLIDCTGFISCLAFSPDGRYLLASRPQQGARLFDVSTRLPAGPLFKGRQTVCSAALSPDGALLLAGELTFGDGARLWDPKAGKSVGEPLTGGPSRVWAVAFSPNGERFLVGSLANAAHLFQTSTRALLVPPLRHKAEVRVVAFSPDGSLILTGSVDKTSRLWDAASGKPVGPIMMQEGPIEAGAFSPDGRRILTAGGDATARLWGPEPRPPLAFKVHPQAAINAARFSPDGKVFATAGSDGIVKLWDAASGKSSGRPLAHPQQASAACFSPDGSLILTGGGDDSARLWDVASGELVRGPFRHENDVNVVAFSPDGKTLVTMCQSGVIKFWDAASGEPAGETLRHSGAIDAGAFSPDGKILATGADDGSVILWDVAARRPMGLPFSHPGAVSSAAFSPDGESFVIGGEDGTARRWDIATRRPIGPPLTHRAWIFAVAVSPDGSLILTGSRDQTAQLWDAATGMPVGPPLSNPRNGTLMSVAFSPDGKSILTGGTGGVACMFWVFPPVLDDRERAALWVEVFTGLSLDDQGSIRSLNNAEWRERRDRLKALGGPPIGVEAGAAR